MSMPNDQKPTPDTDAVAGFVIDSNYEHPQTFELEPDGPYAPADFARDLERRLHAAEAERYQLATHSDELHAINVKLTAKIKTRADIKSLCYLFYCAYHLGHHDTVESNYTDVRHCDRHSYWQYNVEEVIRESDEFEISERDAALAEVKEANEAMVRVGNNAERLRAEVERLKGEAGNKDITIRVFEDELATLRAAQKEAKQQVADLQAELRASNRNWGRALPRTVDAASAEVARLTKERDDASQVSPSEREGILSHISSMLSDAEQEEFGLTGRQLHMQVLRVLSAYRNATDERDTLAATVATLTQEREEFIRYCQSLRLSHGEVGPIQVARMHIERLAATVTELQRDREAMLIALDSAAQIFEEMDGVTWNEDSDWQGSSYAGAADEVVKTLAAMQAKGAQ